MYVDDIIIFDVDETSVQELLTNLGKWTRLENKAVCECFWGIKNYVGEKRLVSRKIRHNLIEIQKKNFKISNRFLNRGRSLFQQLVGQSSF